MSRNLSLLALILISASGVCAQEMTSAEYGPKSTLVVPEHRPTRAKYPFIDEPDFTGQRQEYEDFLSTGDPAYLARLAIDVPLATISRSLAAYPRTPSPQPIERSLIAQGETDPDYFRCVAISGDSSHILFTRMKLQKPDPMSNPQGWKVELIDSVPSPDGWTSTVLFSISGGIEDVRLLSDSRGQAVVMFAATNQSRGPEHSMNPSETKIFSTRLESGIWSPPQPLLDRTLPWVSGFDAAFDSEGRLHLVYSVPLGDNLVARHLVLDKEGRGRSDRVVGDLRPNDAATPRILKLEPALVAIVSTESTLIVHPGKVLLSGRSPIFIAGDLDTDHSVLRSPGGATVAAKDIEGRHIVWWLWRDGGLSPARRLRTPVSDHRTTFQILRGGDSPVFLVVRPGGVFVVQREGKRDEAAALFSHARESTPVTAYGRLLGPDRIELVLSDGSALQRLVFRAGDLQWKPLERALWLDVQGRDFSEAEKTHMHLLLKGLLRRARGDERVSILRSIAKQFYDPKVPARLERVCRTAMTPQCIDYREERDSMLCASWKYTETCRQREWRALEARCSSGEDQSEPCVRWRYESGRAMDPFLAAAFEGERAALDAIDPKLQRRSKRELERFRNNSIKEQPQQLRPWFAKEGFPLAAELLRDRDPRVRSAAAIQLASFDLLRATPFLVGLITDCDWRLSVIPTDQPPNLVSVCGTARGLLHRFPYLESGLLPVDVEQTMGKERAFQRFVMSHYKAHHQQSYRGGSEFAYVAAIALDLGIDGIEAKRLTLGRAIDRLVRLELYTSGQILRFRQGSPIEFSLTLRNLGREEISVRTDLYDRSVHRLQLIGPDGSERMLREEALPKVLPFPIARVSGDLLNRSENVQGLIGAGTIVWPLYLHTLFDISQPGRYVFRYRYVPPATLEPGELSTPQHFKFWNGRDFASELQFEIVP